jgi:hypothetical protein
LGDIAVVGDLKINPEYWPPFTAAVYQMLVAVRHHLLQQIQLQQEGTPSCITQICLADLAPLVVGVAGHCLPTLGARQRERILSIAAFIVE